MSLLNPLASAAQASHSPSRADGIPRALEDELRVWGCRLIQDAGTLLRLPQAAMASAQLLFQRFWYVSSFRDFSIKDIVPGVIFLASKLEEAPVRIRDLLNVMAYLLARASHASSMSPSARALELPRAPPKPSSSRFSHAPVGYFDASFYEAKDALVVAEMQVLKRLGFNTSLSLPYATLVNYLQMLGATGGERWEGFAQRCWGTLNDALQTPVYCLFAPHVLAAASIYYNLLHAPDPAAERPALPLEPPWWVLLDVTEAELRCVSAHIAWLYHPEGGGRVRDEHGGMVAFADRASVREWLEANQAKERHSQENGTRAEGTDTRIAEDRDRQ